MNITKNNITNKYEDYGICVRFPPKLHSLGMWDDKDPFTYAVPTLEVQMVTIFCLTQLIYYPLKRLGISRTFCEIVVGIILGPTSPVSYKNLTEKLFPIDTQEVISTVSAFGYMFFMFVIGVKTDLTVIKTIGRKAFLIGISAFLFPLLTGIGISQLFFQEFIEQQDVLKRNLYPAVITQSVSPFPVIALLLKDLKIINSDLGRLAVSSAICSEVLNISLMFLLLTYTSYLGYQQSIPSSLLDIALAICFMLVILLVVRPTALWMIRHTPEGRPVRDSYVYSIIVIVLMAGFFTQWIGYNPILGAILTGLSIPDGPPLATALAEKLDAFISGLFLPLFVSLIALRVNLLAINLSSPFSISSIVLIVVAFTVKVLACLTVAWICGVPFKDGLALGLIMSSKGVVHMSHCNMFRNQQEFNEETFAVMVTSIAVATILVPILVKKIYVPSRKYTGYQRRSIVNLEQDVLSMVMCIHKSDNIPAFINLLNISCPSRESTLTVYVLHLIELNGRAAPLFITHQLQQKNDDSYYYSQDVIFAFTRHAKQHHGAVWMHAFTAVSPRKLMHEDICNLALNKVAALIVIPFHRKWAIDGSIETEDLALRSINCKILDMAPCSVGVLVDRGHNQVQQCLTAQSSSPPHQRVAVIFFGGSDDREALSYAKHRMAGKLSTQLTVVRFISTVDRGFDYEEERLDSDALDDLKSIGSDSVSYVEPVVNDGSETAVLIREMAGQFDFIIVGRQRNVELPQITGLEEWSEFPELGVIGDILASTDLKGRASVLVVQQH